MEVRRVAVSNHLDEQTRVLTIGHSNHSFAQFLPLIEQHGVEELIDVRTSPFSRWATDFNRESLEMDLENAGIGYMHMGGALGGRPRSLDLYDPDWIADYELMATTEDFDDDIRQLERIAEERVVCLLCSERQPEDCHRTLLVSEALVRREISARHILATGLLEDHESVVERLMIEYQRKAKSPDMGMFPSREQTRKAALRWQAKQVAFRLDRLPASTDEHDWVSEH